MARVTVEDCIKHFPNRFEMTLAAAARARQISIGATPKTVGNERDKPAVIALREIAEGLIGTDILLKAHF